MQLKYPPDIPKISQVHISENLKSPSRLIQPVRTRFSTGNIPPPSLASPSSSNQSTHQSILHRLPSPEEEQVANQTQAHSRIPGVHNQQDMLKFVRKPDTDSASSASNNSSTTTATTPRVSMDQNRHLQASTKFFLNRFLELHMHFNLHLFLVFSDKPISLFYIPYTVLLISCFIFKVPSYLY